MMAAASQLVGIPCGDLTPTTVHCQGANNGYITTGTSKRQQEVESFHYKDGPPTPGGRLERKREKDMTEKTGNRKIIGAGGRLYLLALLAIVFTAVPILTAPAEGSTQCPVPQKKSNAIKQPKPYAALPRGVRPPIDLIAPAGTETATFALG
jgi:hypothetical protein